MLICCFSFRVKRQGQFRHLWSGSARSGDPARLTLQQLFDKELLLDLFLLLSFTSSVSFWITTDRTSSLLGVASEAWLCFGRDSCLPCLKSSLQVELSELNVTFKQRESRGVDDLSPKEKKEISNLINIQKLLKTCSHAKFMLVTPAVASRLIQLSNIQFTQHYDLYEDHANHPDLKKNSSQGMISVKIQQFGNLKTPPNFTASMLKVFLTRCHEDYWWLHQNYCRPSISTSKWLPIVLRFYYDHRDLTKNLPQCCTIMPFPIGLSPAYCWPRPSYAYFEQNKRWESLQLPDLHRRSHADLTTLMEIVPHLAHDWSHSRPLPQTAWNNFCLNDHELNIISACKNVFYHDIILRFQKKIQHLSN